MGDNIASANMIDPSPIGLLVAVLVMVGLAVLFILLGVLMNWIGKKIEKVVKRIKK